MKVGRPLRSMRLQGYDYSSDGAYFITICSHDRGLLFQSRDVQDAILQTWLAIPLHFHEVALDSFVVMPNHVHGVIVVGAPVGSQHAGTLQEPRRRPSLGTIIRSFKSAATRELHLSGLLELHQPVWQANFHDRVIRNDYELDRIREYIAANPSQWAFDHDNQEAKLDARYVETWGWLEDAKARQPVN